MKKPIEKIVCPFCGTTNDVYQDDLGFEEFECSTCECTFEIPENVDEIQAESIKNKQALAEYDKATHVRIMCLQETGEEKCLEGMLDANNPLLEIAISGYKAKYPECQIWVEDEETTSAGFRRQAMLELDCRCIPSYMYDPEY